MSPRIIHIPLSGGDRKAQAKGIRYDHGIHESAFRESVLIRSAAEAKIREADRLECEAWNAIMWAGGPAMPSPGDPQAEPTIGKAMNADGNVSASAITAPFGYGERVSTIMNRTQRLGDRLTQASPDSMPTQGMQMQFEQRIKSTIEGMIQLAHQIDAELPARYAQLDALKNQRDIFCD
jgi:hypothetical protein